MIQEIDSSYADLELNLKRQLEPVKPDPDFVRKLDRRLKAEKAVYLEPIQGQKSSALILLGFLFGVGVILFWASKVFRK